MDLDGSTATTSTTPFGHTSRAAHLEAHDERHVTPENGSNAVPSVQLHYHRYKCVFVHTGENGRAGARAKVQMRCRRKRRSRRLHKQGPAPQKDEHTTNTPHAGHETQQRRQEQCCAPHTPASASGHIWPARPVNSTAHVPCAAHAHNGSARARARRRRRSRARFLTRARPARAHGAQ